MKTWTTILCVWLASCVFIPAQTLQAIYNFNAPYTGANGRLLVLGGTLYGTTGGGGTASSGSIFKIRTNGSSYSVIKSFSAVNINTSTNVDGSYPMDGVVIYGNTLYGTTYNGGFGSRGTVFSVTTNGTSYTVLNHFSVTNGKNPYVGLTLWSNVLYGTTAAGGISNKGAIFRVNADGSGFTLLKSIFLNEGVLLLSRVVTDGSTVYGSIYSGGISNRGSIYSMGVNGDNFTILKQFSEGEGAGPRFNLMLSDTTLFGVTESGGATNDSVIFRLNTNGTGFSTIKQFSPGDDVNGTNSNGSSIWGGLSLWNGVLYGSTRYGGTNGNGVVFKLNLDGTGFAVLKHFSATTSSGGGPYINVGGMNPHGDLTIADGVIYGATLSGGTYGYGTLYRLTIPPNPALQTTNVTGQLVVYWTDDGYNRTLQTSSDLFSGNWNSVTNLNWTNASVLPKQIGLSISDTSATAAFFRLQ